MTPPLTIKTDRTLIRAGARSTRYVLARVTAPRAPRNTERHPINLGLVLDRSGSMESERKFGLARDAVEQALRMLRPEDRFALVVYDNAIDVLAPSTRATSEAKRLTLDALDAVRPRGCTNLGGGWLRGCEQVAQFLDRENVSRCLLLTDGLANEGITDRDTLANHASELRRRGVATSTFGVGADFDERLLRDMAHEGGGNFYFIEGATQIPEMLTGELGEALEITLRDAAIVVRSDGGARVDCLNRFRQRVVDDVIQTRSEANDVILTRRLIRAIHTRRNPLCSVVSQRQRESRSRCPPTRTWKGARSKTSWRCYGANGERPRRLRESCHVSKFRQLGRNSQAFSELASSDPSSWDTPNQVYIVLRPRPPNQPVLRLAISSRTAGTRSTGTSIAVCVVASYAASSSAIASSSVCCS